MRLLGQASLALWIMALIIGTVVHFTYTQAPAEGTNGCFFADPGSMRVACAGFSGAELIAYIFSLAWFCTWGIWWKLVQIPYSLDLLAPAGMTLWLALNYLFDFTGPDEDEQAA